MVGISEPVQGTQGRVFISGRTLSTRLEPKSEELVSKLGFWVLGVQPKGLHLRVGVGGWEGRSHAGSSHPDSPEEHEHWRPDHVLLWRLAVPAEGQENPGV